jgi:hypothetical protein
LNVLYRRAQKDDVIPLRYPVLAADGKTWIDTIPVPKGTEIHTAMLSANISQEMWGDDGMQWKPDRWLEPMRNTLVEAKVPGVFPPLMTFYHGARGISLILIILCMAKIRSFDSLHWV